MTLQNLSAQARIAKLKSLVDGDDNIFSDGTKKYSHERVFLLDVSDSMRHGLIEAKNVVATYIQDGDGCYVFGNSVQYVSFRKLKHLQTMGLTAMLPAIKKAVEEVKGLVEILLITDGDPNVDEEEMNNPGLFRGFEPFEYQNRIIDYACSLTGIVISCVGIGREVNMSFLEELARVTKGKCSHIETVEELDNAVTFLLDAPKAITV